MPADAVTFRRGFGLCGADKIAQQRPQQDQAVAGAARQLHVKVAVKPQYIIALALITYRALREVGADFPL
ncbi:hypothetical protein BK025_15600 [Sodalis sp. TME1]|nr:hypothetical protein BK025_15600 [Sodalis sp. TME1]